MRLDKFLETRRGRWEDLEILVKRARGRRLARMDGADILRLGRLYRETTADLAIARRDFPHEQVTSCLNALLARAHPLVYRERALDRHRIMRFWRYGFPAAYRATGPYTALALGLFAVAALVSALLVAIHPANANLLLPGQAQSLRTVMQQHHLWMKSATSNHSVAADFITINNIQVALLAWAGGSLVGLGSVFVLVTNGIDLGTLAAMVAQYHLSAQFWSFVVPHGVIELSVIFMAGGAGLRVGDAILRPGLRRRGDAFARAARNAVALAVGAVPLLMVAGTIEGFFSASNAPIPLKYVVGLVSGFALYSFLLLSRPQR